jgi:hypothetical protein
MASPVPPFSIPPRDDAPLDDDRWARGRAWLGSAQGWVGDLGRLAWALVSLNLRKTRFRMRGGACPCQNPSDSGRAGETACDPVASWHSAARFRRVCPLLLRRADGAWKCSVNAAEVRPFWGRAAGYAGGTTIAVYLLATFLAFGFLRAVGYPVHYHSVAWPGSWRQIRAARAQYFFALAQRELSQNNAIGASMALSQSYDLDPGNYAAGRILAQLWQPGGEEILNRLYRQLMADHPEMRSQTAQAWFGALLQHGDFATIETVALERLQAEPAQASAWLNALLVASRRTADAAVLDQAIRRASGLPSFVGEVCRLELQLRTADPNRAGQLLTAPLAASAAPFLQYYRIDRLLRGGFPDETLWQFNHAGDQLALRDRAALSLEIDTAFGWRTILISQVGQLLDGGVSAPLIEMLSAHLIRHPDAAVLAETLAALDHHPLPRESERVSAYASLFCAAGASGDAAQTKALAETLRQVTGSRLVVLDDVAAWLQGDQVAMPAERYLPALPLLPPEVDYALFEFADRRRMTLKAASATAKPAITAP